MPAFGPPAMINRYACIAARSPLRRKAAARVEQIMLLLWARVVLAQPVSSFTLIRGRSDSTGSGRRWGPPSPGEAAGQEGGEGERSGRSRNDGERTEGGEQEAEVGLVHW